MFLGFSWPAAGMIPEQSNPDLFVTQSGGYEGAPGEAVGNMTIAKEGLGDV